MTEDELLNDAEIEISDLKEKIASLEKKLEIARKALTYAEIEIPELVCLVDYDVSSDCLDEIKKALREIED